MKNSIIKYIEELGELDIILYLLEKGIFKRNKYCMACKIPMDLKRAERRFDKYEWRCTNNRCANRTSTLSVRDGSWVSGFKQILKEILIIMYYISLDITATRIKILANIGNDSYQRYKAVIYLKLKQHYLDSPILLGGHYKKVQVDETMISFKGKNHKGLNATKKAWAICITDNSTKPSLGYVEIIENKTAETLIAIIKRVVRPGTAISTDEFRSYSSLARDPNYTHLTVCHK